MFVGAIAQLNAARYVSLREQIKQADANPQIYIALKAAAAEFNLMHDNCQNPVVCVVV